MQSVPHSFSWTQHFGIFILVSLLSTGHRCISQPLNTNKCNKKIANISCCICWTVETKLNVKIELQSHLLCIAMAIIYFCFSIWLEFARRSVYKKRRKRRCEQITTNACLFIIPAQSARNICHTLYLSPSHNSWNSEKLAAKGMF